MRVLSILLLSNSLVQQSASYPRPVTTNVHPTLTRSDFLTMPAHSEPTAFQQLLSLAITNSMPLGIVVSDPDLCRAPLRLPQAAVSVQTLAAAVEEQVPGYRVQMQEGVLNVLPAQMPKLVADLLNFRLRRFHSSPDLIKFMAQEIWLNLRSETAPMEGWAGGGLSGPEEETVPGIDRAGATTKELLNAIVDEGSGGFWLVRASEVKELHTAWLPSPIGAWGYKGAEHYLVGFATCGASK